MTWTKLQFVFAGCVALLCLLPSCSPGQARQSPQPTRANEEAFIDALGRRYVPATLPRRIVSLSPAVTEILFAIGAGETVVGVTQHCDYPLAARELVSVGGFAGATVSVEQIRALSPDLVILSADMHARIVALLDNLGIPSFAVEPGNFSQVYQTIALIGKLSGFVSGAGNVIAEMKETIARVQDSVQGREPPAVFWVLSEDPLMTAGGETFISEVITLAGGTNIFAELREQWPLVSPEQLLVRRPDWVLSGSGMGAAENHPGVRNPILQNLPAVREGRVAFVDGDILYRFGPRLARAVALVAEIIHHE